MRRPRSNEEAHSGGCVCVCAGARAYTLTTAGAWLDLTTVSRRQLTSDT